MDDEEFGTSDDYFRAFEAVRDEGIPDSHLALLRAHFAAPDHTATWAQLASAVGYANFNAVNLHFGKLAARVAATSGYDSRLVASGYTSSLGGPSNVIRKATTPLS